MIPICYSGFFDKPLAFVAEYQGHLYYFSRGGFDDELDDYPRKYKVFLIHGITFEKVRDNWLTIWEGTREYICSLHMDEVTFDPTAREAVDVAILARLARG